MKTRLKKRIAILLVMVMPLTSVVANAATCDCNEIVKLEVRVTGKLPEGQKITKKDVKKALNVTAIREGGAKKLKYTSYKVKNLGTKVKANSKGYCKVKLTAGSAKKTVLVKVNRLKKIYIKQTKQMPLQENSKFSKAAFKKVTSVWGDYKEDEDKKLLDYQVVAPSTVTADSNGEFVVTVKAYGKKDKIAIPVIPAPATEVPTTPATEVPTTPATEVPTAPATEVPTTPATEVPTTPATEVPTAPATEVPTTPATEVPTAPATEVPTTPATAVPTAPATEVPTTPATEVPTTPATAVPTATATEVPTATATEVPTTPATEVPTAPATEVPTEAPTVNVTINRNGGGVVTFNNATCDFTNPVVETVTKGNEVTLRAANTSSDKFVRWTDNSGNELSTSREYTFTATADTEVLAVFEKVYDVTINRNGGRGKVTIAGESLDFYSNVATYTTTPGRYELVAVSTDDYNFVSWTDAKGNVLSTNPTYIVSVATSDVDVTVNFAEAEKTVNVTYMHENGQLLITDAVTFGETLTPPTNNLYRTGKQFAGWRIGEDIYLGNANDSEFISSKGEKLSDAIKALTAAKQDVNVVAYHIDDPTKYYSVTVASGGAITEYKNGTVSDDGKYSYDTYVTVTADVPEGKYFAGWSNGTSIVSNKEVYGFYVTDDVTLTPEFTDSKVEAEPIVTVTSYNIDVDNNVVTLQISTEIPKDYTIVENGILYTFKDLDVSDMNIDNKTIGQHVDSNATQGQWTSNAQGVAAVLQTGKTMKVRGYITVSSTKGTQTFYSEVVSISLASE